MKKTLGLICGFCSAATRQKPVHGFSVKIFSKSPGNADKPFEFYSPSRKLCRSSVFNVSSSTRVGASDQENAEKKSAIDQNPVIYYGALTSQIKGVKIFTCTSSVGGLVIQPIIIQNLMTGIDIPLTLALGTTVGFFTFVTPFLIHLLTKKYITEMRYNSATDIYTATTLSFFLRRINVEFKLEDVTIPDNQSLFTTFLVKGKPYFMTSDSFLVVDHYIRLMGYDKPIDLKLSTPFNKLDENQIGKDKNVASHGG